MIRSPHAIRAATLPAAASATHASTMRAAWYDRRGPAREVLQVGELPLPTPGPGEVRVRIRRSGINPGDTKKRSGFFDPTMPYPRVIPHSDGAGTIDAVGEGVDAARMGARAWVFGAQSYRPFGTAAEAVVVPDRLAADLPDGVSDDLGATLGIAGITAHRAVFSDGPVAGTTVLVQGILGGVGSMAAQLALWAGATVIGTVRSERDRELASHRLDVAHVALDSADPVDAIRRLAPDGIDRVVEVSFSDNVDLDAAVLRNGGVIAAYATRDERPSMPFWPMLFDNITVRLLGSDDFAPDARAAAVADLARAAADGSLSASTVVLPLEQIAKAHDLVDRGLRERVLIRLD